MTGSTIRVPSRRLPAYARPLAELRRQGLRPEGQTVIVRLDSWPPKEHLAIADPESGECCEFKPGRAGKVWWPQVVVTPDAKPVELDYGFLRDLDAVVAHWRSLSTPERLKSLLREVLQAGPRSLMVLDMESQPRRFWWVKSITRGVEVAL